MMKKEYLKNGFQYKFNYFGKGRLPAPCDKVGNFSNNIQGVINVSYNFGKRPCKTNYQNSNAVFRLYKKNQIHYFYFYLIITAEKG